MSIANNLSLWQKSSTEKLDFFCWFSIEIKQETFFKFENPILPTMKKTLILSLILLLNFSCKKDKIVKVDSAKEVSQIPYGESGELESGNYSGEGGP